MDTEAETSDDNDSTSNSPPVVAPVRAGRGASSDNELGDNNNQLGALATEPGDEEEDYSWISDNSLVRMLIDNSPLGAASNTRFEAPARTAGSVAGAPTKEPVAVPVTVRGCLLLARLFAPALQGTTLVGSLAPSKLSSPHAPVGRHGQCWDTPARLGHTGARHS